MIITEEMRSQLYTIKTLSREFLDMTTDDDFEGDDLGAYICRQARIIANRYLDIEDTNSPAPVTVAEDIMFYSRYFYLDGEKECKAYALARAVLALDKLVYGQ